MKIDGVQMNDLNPYDFLLSPIKPLIDAYNLPATPDVVEMDAKKVIPYFLDTLSIHPDAPANNDAAALSKIGLDSLVAASERPSAVQEMRGKVYDLAQWVWGLVMPHVQTDVVDNKDIRSQPKFENPYHEEFSIADREKFVMEMRQVINRLKELSEDEFAELNLESALVEIYKYQIQHKENMAVDGKKTLVQEHHRKKEISKERLDKLNDIVASAQQSNVWGAFEKAATGLGLAAIGVGAGLSGGWSVVAFLGGIGMVADQMFDDPVKKKIATLITSDLESENTWLERLKLGCGLATVAVYAGLGGAQGFQAAMNISKGASIGVKGYLDHTTKQDSASLMELKSNSIKADDNIKKELSGLKEHISSVFDYQRNLSQINKSMLETSISMHR